VVQIYKINLKLANLYEGKCIYNRMELMRYIIWTTSFEDTNIVMDILKPHSSVVVSISDVIVCVETKLTMARIRNYVGDEMEMACLEMDDKFINRLQTKKFLKEEKKNFERFLSMTFVPTSINEALDLINERGGVEFLTDRERDALDKMTNKSSSS
jgi:hypothetical protein